MSKKRAHRNNYSDYKSESRSQLLSDEVSVEIESTAESLLSRIELDVNQDPPSDYSVYTGISGIAFLFLLLGERVHDSFFNRALECIEEVLPRLRNRNVSFLTGDAGPLALGAVLFAREGNDNEKSNLISQLTGPLLRTALDLDLPDEMLYGRAGYLYSLLFINKHLGEDTIPVSTIRRVVSAILCSGINLARQEQFDVPLMYKWHDTYYVGAAHGLAGILFMLLQAKNYLERSELETLVCPTIDYLQEVRYPSGNFRSSLDSENDKLVQWCHGAPGMVDLFCLAYGTFGREVYLDTALECGEIVWRRGLLKKGYSICHGVAGNAYSFLSLFRATQDLKHLHRAIQFAKWCNDYGTHQVHYPDHPMSLFEGVSGVVHFIYDVQQPERAAFPAYVL
ncbi:lanC-like protein 2 [Anabrus simplex]|uniref:lanC-like protein 2 n=1 Tax=Anabrus simplex TaxID=316456 RepID=UPI0035A286EF